MAIKKEYRKVLVPLDGSESSFHALKQAFQFSSTEKSWITVVCVAPDYEGDLDTLATGGDLLAKMRQPCEKVLVKARDIAAQEGYSIKTILEEGEPSRRIVETADAYNRELIIMGRRGLSNLERAFVGSVTQRVIGQCHGDVVVVPDGVTLAWEKILVATDGSPCSQAAVERAIRFARAYDGAIDVVSVADIPAELYGEAPDLVEELVRKAKMFAEDAVQLVKSKGITATPHVAEGNAYEIIPELALTLGAQVIVAGSHGRTGMGRLLLGSVAEKIIGFASCPVLIARP
ncbi:MAG: universal stress protein [Desulfobulbaceae bacterium]|nr:universal stress protein [Desulfobulbaceae bacterium]